MLLAGNGCCSRAFLYGRTGLTPGEVAELGARDGWTAGSLRSDGVGLNGLMRMPSSPDAPWILYFGGNATSLEGSQHVLTRLAGNRDVGLAAFAYRGYDGSQGNPTQRALTRDGLAAVAHLEKIGVKREQLAIVGQSLGGGVAAQVTAELAGEGHPPAALVLVSPFTSVLDVVRDHVVCMPSCLVTDKWATKRRTHELRLPVLVLHGTKDSIIPMAQGEAVAAAIPGARFERVEGRDHNDIWTDDAVEAARAFVLEHTR